MNQDGHQQIYRAAFEAASRELSEIQAMYEQLRARKDQIDKMVAVLKPLVGVDGQGPTLVQQAPSESGQQGAASPSGEAEQGANPSYDFMKGAQVAPARTQPTESGSWSNPFEASLKRAIG